MFTLFTLTGFGGNPPTLSFKIQTFKTSALNRVERDDKIKAIRDWCDFMCHSVAWNVCNILTVVDSVIDFLEHAFLKSSSALTSTSDSMADMVEDNRGYGFTSINSQKKMWVKGGQ